jgi:hypothetical protein
MSEKGNNGMSLIYKVANVLFKINAWKGFSKVVYWKKTGVDSKSHKPDKAQFPKDAWQR